MTKASRELCKIRDQQEPMYRFVELISATSGKKIYVACHTVMLLTPDNGHTELTFSDGSTIKVEGTPEEIWDTMWVPGSEYEL